MKLRNIKTIISREFLTRVRKKSFLLITFLGPVFFAAVCILPSVIMFMAEDKGKQVAVVDQSGIVMPKFVDTEAIDFTEYKDVTVDSLKTVYDDLGLDAIVVISPLDTLARAVEVTAYSSSPISVDMKEAISTRVDEAVEDYRLSLYDIGDLKQIMEDARFNSTVATYTIGEDGEEKISSSEVYMVISLLLSMIIYMFIAMFTGMVMQSVIEEKSSRVVEVLVSSVKATELMFGKIIGVACVALTQFLLWIVLTAVIVTGVSSFIGFDSLMESSAMQTEQMTMMAMPDAAEFSAYGEAGAILSTLKDLDYGMLLLGFVIYFALGYLLYASLFAAIGSAVENEALRQTGEPFVNGFQIPLKALLILIGVCAHQQVFVDRQLLEDSPPLGDLGHSHMHNFVAGCLGNVLSLKKHGPGLFGNQTGNTLHGSGFSGAVGTDQGHDLPLLHMKTDALQCTDHTVIYLEIIHF